MRASGNEKAMTATKHAPAQVVAMPTHRSDREFPKTSGTRNNPKGSGTLPGRRVEAVEAMTARIHRSEPASETAAIRSRIRA